MRHLRPNPTQSLRNRRNAMSRLMRHRGPDDEGFALFDGQAAPALFGGTDNRTFRRCALDVAWLPPRERLAEQSRSERGGLPGHRRLSIIDLSPHGHQPMSGDAGRFWITYNGEFYNYIGSLRDELRAAGHRFYSGSDTEVILAAYRQWGAGCLAYFNGMWALAIFDRQAKTLFLARDRFGVKPLYCWRQGDRLAFASEIKAFTGLNGWRAKADRERLLDFLVWNVLDHGERTMFEGVRQLPPGHHVTLDLASVFAGGIVPEWRPQRWYALPEAAVLVAGQAAVDGLQRSPMPFACACAPTFRWALACPADWTARRSSADGRAAWPGHAARRGTAHLHCALARRRVDEFRYAQAVIERAGSTAHTVVPEPKCGSMTSTASPGTKMSPSSRHPFSPSGACSGWRAQPA